MDESLVGQSPMAQGRERKMIGQSDAFQQAYPLLQRYAACIATVSRLPLAGVGHVPHEEKPELGLAAVRAFLKPAPRLQML